MKCILCKSIIKDEKYGSMRDTCGSGGGKLIYLKHLKHCPPLVFGYRSIAKNCSNIICIECIDKNIAQRYIVTSENMDCMICGKLTRCVKDMESLLKYKPQSLTLVSLDDMDHYSSNGIINSDNCDILPSSACEKRKNSEFIHEHHIDKSNIKL